MIISPAFTHAIESFNFEVKEIEITDNGNIFSGLNRGQIKTNDGITINADTFKYNKLSDVLETSGNVIAKDAVNDFIIYTNKIKFFKKNIIINDGNSKAKNSENNKLMQMFWYHNRKIK